MRVIRSQIRSAALAVAAIMGVSVVAPTAASAAPKACTVRTTTKAFAKFGDDNDYFHVENGDFESGGAGWTVNYGSPYLTADNQNLVQIKGGRNALVLPPGTSVTSDEFCTTINEDAMRLFFKPLWQGSSLMVTVEVRSTSGWASAGSMMYSFQAGQWDASARVPVPAVYDKNGQQITRITLAVYAGWVAIDDVMVDPSRPK